MMSCGLASRLLAAERMCVRSGSRMGVRQYSSEAGKDSMFLTNLLSRIDKISSTTKKIAEKQGSVGPSGKNRPLEARTRASAPGEKNLKARSEKVQVSDHPLFNAKLENRTPGRGSGFRGPRQPRVARTGGASSGAGSKPGNRPARAREPRRQRVIDVQPIKSKTLTYGPYQPELNNSTFLYGKATSFNNCTSARVASVAKEALNDSKYPFLLPKDIVNKVAPGITRNKFLLQSNFTLEVNAAKITTRIKEVVKGEFADLPLDKSQFKDPEALKSALFTKQQLMKNGDLSMADKQKIFDVASGLKAPKLLVENAHWAKTE